MGIWQDWAYDLATLVARSDSPWAAQTVTLTKVSDSPWAYATGRVIAPGVPNLITPAGERTPLWSVLLAGGGEAPVRHWTILQGGVEVPLIHHDGTWDPQPITVGADPVGAATYPVPGAGALFVAPGGDDGAAGTQAAPLRTLAAALGRATSGTTIVVREGTYYEGDIEAGAKPGVTVQNYPGEAAWFDGTTPLTGWTVAAGVWSAPYTLAYDRQLGVGARISSVWTGAATRVIVDQVWVDGTKLVPLVDGSTPAAGQFSVDRTAGQLRIGTDPTGKAVRVATRNFLLAAGGITIRGIGVRRYAPNRLEWRGAALVLSDGATAEQVTVEHSSVDGIATYGAGCTIRRCTVQDIGHSGIQGDHANGGLIERNLIRRIDRGLWGGEPATAGIKIGRTFEGLTIRHNHLEDMPEGCLIWFDTTVSRSFVYGNTLDGTSTVGSAKCKYGIMIEVADGGYYDGVQYWHHVIGNRISNFRQAAFLAFDSSYIRLWNNALSAAVAIWARQDYRQNDGSKSAKEGTIEQSPWHTHHLEVVNNIVIPEPAYNTQLRGECATDAPFKIAGGAMFSRIDGNWFRPQGTGLFAYLTDAPGTTWSNRSTLAALASTTAQFGGPLAPILGVNHQQTTPPTALGVPLDPDVARAIGAPDGYQPPIGPLWPPLVLAQGSNG